MRAFLLAGLVALGLMGGTVAPVAAQEAGRTMIIMDGSGSMWGRIGKQPKLKIAKRAVIQFLKRLPNEMEVGLMAYGHRREGDCDDIQVLVKPGEDTDRKINRPWLG
jgi:Ca-activated chloride channel family protein